MVEAAGAIANTVGELIAPLKFASFATAAVTV
jgi:hypothetical protein